VEECERQVKEIVSLLKGSQHAATIDTKGNVFDWIGKTGIAIGGRRSGKPPDCWENFSVVINCGALQYEEHMKLEAESKDRYLFLSIPEGKKGQHALYQYLPQASDYILKSLKESKQVLVHCAQGT
jgi:tRNA A64-2'-O-ribosylphosphate transferase